MDLNTAGILSGEFTRAVNEHVIIFRDLSICLIDMEPELYDKIVIGSALFDVVLENAIAL